jgi:hypothetical protein
VPPFLIFFSTFTLLSPISAPVSISSSSMSWWQLHAPATWLAPLLSLRTNHHPHTPIHN